MSAIFSQNAKACTRAQISSRVRADYAMDVETGATLYASNAGTKISPASLTKQMVTLLVLEDARSAGSDKINLQDSIILPSTHLQGPGTYQNSDAIPWNVREVKLGDALFALLRLSSDRVAQYFDTPDFVARMNAKAAELKLTDTHFLNTSGYPTAEEQKLAGTMEGHYSTAADLAKIAATLHREFADEMKAFNFPSQKFTGRDSRGRDVAYKINTAVNLLPGARMAAANVVDGKTGYICRSGYNLDVVAEIDGRSVVWVSIGHPDKNGRDRYVRSMVTNPLPELRAALAQADTYAPKTQMASLENSILKTSGFLRRTDNSFINFFNRSAGPQYSPLCQWKPSPGPVWPGRTPLTPGRVEFLAIRQEDHPLETPLQPMIC